MALRGRIFCIIFCTINIILCNDYFCFGSAQNFQQLFTSTTTTMAGHGKPDLSGYNYGAISSLVLTADRSALPRRDKEPDAKPGLSGYNYGSISSLILTADRSALPRRDKDHSS